MNYVKGRNTPRPEPEISANINLCQSSNASRLPRARPNIYPVGVSVLVHGSLTPPVSWYAGKHMCTSGWVLEGAAPYHMGPRSAIWGRVSLCGNTHGPPALASPACTILRRCHVKHVQCSSYFLVHHCSWNGKSNSLRGVASHNVMLTLIVYRLFSKTVALR